VVFVGDDNPDNIRTIAEISGARVLGRLPWLEPLDCAALLDAFARGFRREDF
jgi:dethiobiotin synthetase